MIRHYYIPDRCAGCGGCHSKCPVNCIDATIHPPVIDQSRCILCGACFAACPIRAMEERDDI